jgi:sec-independent protein translocase protein TatC
VDELPTSKSDLVPPIESGNLPLPPKGVDASAQVPSMSQQSDLPSKDNSGSKEADEKLMTIVEHLDELRTRMLRSLGYVAIGIVVGLIIGKPVLRLLEAPAGGIAFQALSLEEPVIVFFKVAFYCGLVFASPLILFEIGRFVAPGLTKQERRIMIPILVGSPLLFLAGTAFAYFLLLPSMLHFFKVFSQGVTPINQRLDFYISLVSSILLYMGLCFQLPIVIFALSFTGVVNSKVLISFWKYAVFAAAVIAAVTTPDPTVFSMLIVMAALSGLYFLSIVLLKLVGR